MKSCISKMVNNDKTTRYIAGTIKELIQIWSIRICNFNEWFKGHQKQCLHNISRIYEIGIDACDIVAMPSTQHFLEEVCPSLRPIFQRDRLKGFRYSSTPLHHSNSFSAKTSETRSAIEA